MGGEQNGRFAVIAHPDYFFQRSGREEDSTRVSAGVVLAKAVEIDVFDSKPRKIIPHPNEYLLDFSRGLFLLSCGQIGARRPMPAKVWSDSAHHCRGEVHAAIEIYPSQ